MWTDGGSFVGAAQGRISENFRIPGLISYHDDRRRILIFLLYSSARFRCSCDLCPRVIPSLLRVSHQVHLWHVVFLLLRECADLASTTCPDRTTGLQSHSHSHLPTCFTSSRSIQRSPALAAAVLLVACTTLVAAENNSNNNHKRMRQGKCMRRCVFCLYF